MRFILNIIPYRLRLYLKLISRSLKDKSASIKFAKKNYDKQCFKYSIDTIQDIKQSSYFENKLENIKLGAQKIEQYIIEPNDTFSFWKIVEVPSPKNGFKLGRNLIHGKLKADYGGGLCQLSGIIYVCALKAGLVITERHNHTVDIYEEEERFTPLGSDATVVYGYKDLRFINKYKFPIKFSFHITNNNITCKLQSNTEIKENSFDFTRIQENNIIIVSTVSEDKVIAKSVYLKK